MHYSMSSNTHHAVRENVKVERAGKLLKFVPKKQKIPKRNAVIVKELVRIYQLFYLRNQVNVCMRY